MKKLILSSFAVAAFVFVSNTASAQNPITTVEVTIPPVTEFEMITGGEAISTTFSSADLLTGKDVTESVTLHYTSNKASFISIKATNFTGLTGDPINSLPSSIMSFKSKVGAATVSSPTEFTTANAEYKVNLAKGDQNIIITYSLNPTIQANPDTYTSTVTYTITAE